VFFFPARENDSQFIIFAIKDLTLELKAHSSGVDTVATTIEYTFSTGGTRWVRYRTYLMIILIIRLPAIEPSPNLKFNSSSAGSSTGGAVVALANERN